MKIAKNHLGSGFQSSWKMNNHTKLNLPWDFLNALFQFGIVPLFRKKDWPDSNFQHLHDHFFILSINLISKKINWRQN